MTLSYCSGCGHPAARGVELCERCGRVVVKSPPGNAAATGCAAVAILVPVALMVTCFVVSPGPSSSRGAAGEDCKDFGGGRDGWLVDHDRRGEVALWAKPAQRGADNHVNATVAYPAYALGGGMITTVTEECYMPDRIIYYHIQFDEDRSGWVDVDYLSWKRP